MPRRGRVVLAGYPHHVIQRGHNRGVIFISDEDYLYYLANLKEWKEKLGCKVYAYCLMGNHVHLVIDPCEQASGLSLLMKRVAGKQTRYVNALEKRCGTLWEGDKKGTDLFLGRPLPLNSIHKWKKGAVLFLGLQKTINGGEKGDCFF